MNNKIIAVDFDGTLCDNKWPEIGEANGQLIDYLKDEKSKGSKLILWTNRTEDKLSRAVEWCRNHGIEFDAVNDNLPEMIEFFGNNPRKIFANEYIDDHNKLIKSCNISSTQSWAEHEVEIACARERSANSSEDCEFEFDYGCACYESANAFKSLLDDNHSGFSIKLTQHILNRLIDHKPLTSIEDTDDAWSDIADKRDEYVCYQCKRMSSLFKYVYNDGSVTYKDVNRVFCHNVDSSATFTNGFITNMIDEMYPIKLPYYPGNPFEVITEEFLTDHKNGDYDTLGVLYVILPDGSKVDINKYFKDAEHSFEEITSDEYEERRKLADALKEKDNNEL